MFTIALRIIRTKLIASWLGPSGVGLLGTYTSIVSMLSAAGLGIQQSAIREIAHAAKDEDPSRLPHIVRALRRLLLVLGLSSALLMVVMAPLLSVWTFETSEHVWPLRFLGLMVLVNTLFAGQVALIQGLRRIRDLVRASVWGAALGTVVGIPLVGLFQLKGIVPLMLVVSGAQLASSWWYARKQKIERVQLLWKDTPRECKPLLQLGIAMTASGLMNLGVAYLLRLIVLRRLGLDATGYYQAAATLSSLYVGFVLTAMGTDFYPRLSEVSEDHRAMTNCINEQSEVSLLLAAPGIVWTMTLAPLVITMFYSGDFSQSVSILQWQTLGVMLRVVSWPFGYSVLAKGNAVLFFLTELIAAATHLVGIWFGINIVGLKGTGIAFFVLYAVYWVMMYSIAYKHIGFRYSPLCRRVLWMILAAIGVVFCAGQFLTGLANYAVASLVSLCLCYYCIHNISTLIPESRPARIWNNLTGWMRKSDSQ